MITLTFDANGGSFGSNTTDFIAQGGSFIGEVPVIISNNTFSPYLGHISTLALRDGYRCTGWNTNADGTGISYYADGDRPEIISDITLYAKWVRVYTLTYDSNGGSGTFIYGIQTFIEGVVVGVVNPTPVYGFSRLGYKQTHWNTSADNSGTSYYYDAQFEITHDVVLYAIWLEVGYITYDGNGVTSGRTTLNLEAQGINCAYLIDNVITSEGIEWGSVSYILDGQLTAGIPFIKTGYTVVSWNTEADGTGDSYYIYNAYYVKINFSGHITLYAQWKPKATLLYDVVKFSKPYNYPIRGYDSLVVNVKNSTDVFQAPEGFSGEEIYDWNTQADGSGITYHSGSVITLTGDITLYALWKPISYITFDLNGHTEFTIPPRQKLRTDLYSGVIPNFFPNVNIPIASNYVVNYWSDNPDGTGVKHLADNHVFYLEDNDPITFYAIWGTLEFVTFYSDFPVQGTNSGVVPERMDLDFSTSNEVEVVLPEITLTNSIYRHYKWVDDDGIMYALQATIKLVNKGVNLHALWEYMPLLVIDGNGATGGVPTATERNTKLFYNNGNFTPIFVTPITKTGYSLPVASARVFPWIITKIVSSVDQSEFDYTAVANWVKAYIFSYDGNGATGGVLPDSVEIASGNIKVASPGTLVKEGCRFLNWNTSSDGSGDSYVPWSDEVYIPQSTFLFNPDEKDGLPYYPRNVTLYANWVVLYSLKYDLNGGLGGIPQPEFFDKDVTHNTFVTSTVFTRDNYTFTGWNTASDGSGILYLGGGAITVLNEYIILYAQWLEIITVTYQSNILGVPSIVTPPMAVGDSVTIMANTFVNSAYYFISWNTSSNGSGITFNVGDIVTITTRLVLYAIWEYLPEIWFNSNYFLNNVEDVGYRVRYSSGTVIKIPNEPKRQGYIFKWWHSFNPEYPTFLYPGDDLVIKTSDLVLLAEWQPTYSITYSFDGTTNIDVVKVVPLTNPTRIYDTAGMLRGNLIVSHWTTNADGTGSIFLSDSVLTLPDADVILYAQWREPDVYSSNSIYTVYTK